MATDLAEFVLSSGDFNSAKYRHCFPVLVGRFTGVKRPESDGMTPVMDLTDVDPPMLSEKFRRETTLSYCVSRAKGVSE